MKMDSFKAFDITFLDLTGVDDPEKAEVLNSLYSENENVELPWSYTEMDTSQHYEYDYVPPQNQQIYHHHPVDYSSFIPPQNPTVYPNTITYPIPQHSYVVYSPIANYPPQQFVTMVTPYSLQNGAIALNGSQQQYNTPTEPEQEEEEEENEENVEEEKNEITTTTNKVEMEKPNRSWASLFNNSSKTNQVSHVNNDENGSTSNNNDKDEAVKEVENPIKNPKMAQFIDPICYRMGEFLLNYNVDGRTISLQPRGLINKSNYCYVNSILQAILACPPAYNLLAGLASQNNGTEKEKPTPIIDGMCRFVNEFKHLPANLRVNRRSDKNLKKDQYISIDYDLPFEPSWIYKMLNGIRSDSFLVGGRQEDAEEFLGLVLNGLNDEMLELMKLIKNDLIVNKLNNLQLNNNNNNNNNEMGKEWQVMGPKNKCSVTRQMEFVKTPISNIFGGFLKSRIHRTGDQSTSNIEPFFTLPLNIEKVSTVREALDALVTKNQLEGVTSEKTNEEVEAWQQVTLEELPVILILHLKCFDFKLDGCTKIIKALEFPIDLKIDSKLLSSKPTSSKEKQYKLFAVVYHDGKEATKGHYITDAFHVGYSSWIRYDDSSVKAIQEECVLKPQGTRVPYLLFYRRSDTIRSK